MYLPAAVGLSKPQHDPPSSSSSTNPSNALPCQPANSRKTPSHSKPRDIAHLAVHPQTPQPIRPSNGARVIQPKRRGSIIKHGKAASSRGRSQPLSMHACMRAGEIGSYIVSHPVAPTRNDNNPTTNNQQTSPASQPGSGRLTSHPIPSNILVHQLPARDAPTLCAVQQVT